MNDAATFLDVSVELTGFDEFDLTATGMVGDYQRLVENHVANDVLSQLYSTWRAAIGEGTRAQRSAAVAAIMAEPRLAATARQIIALWYVGSWYATPQAPSVVSGQAYVEGLMWRAIGSHPMGAEPQGYAAWASPPPAESTGVQ